VGTAVGCFLYASFELWRNERKNYLRETTSRKLKEEWRNLESKFLEQSSPFLGALWIRIKGQPITTWSLEGASDEIQAQRFMVLMEEAGNLLP
jgi:hypothetical protein